MATPHLHVYRHWAQKHGNLVKSLKDILCMLDEYVWKCDQFSVGDVCDDMPISISITMYLSTKSTIKTNFKAFSLYLKKPSLSTSWKIDSILYWDITHFCGTIGGTMHLAYLR